MSQTLSGFSSELPPPPLPPLSLLPLQPALHATTYAISAHLQPGRVRPVCAHSASTTVSKALLLCLSSFAPLLSLSVYSLLPLSLLMPSVFYTAYHITSYQNWQATAMSRALIRLRWNLLAALFVKPSIAYNTNTHSIHIYVCIYSTNTHICIWHSTHSFRHIYWQFFPRVLS